MKIGNNIALILLVSFAGCADVPDRGECPSADSGNRQMRSEVRPQRIPPRISRWFAKSKIEFGQGEGDFGVYRLALESPEPFSADRREYVRGHFRSRVAESFAERNALDPRQVMVALLSEKMETNTYYGEATACGMDDISLSYDPVTRRGTLAMKMRNGDFDGTRKLIRQHIETVVRDRNIRLVAGVPPPPGHYYLLGETVKPGNLLEIEFKSE